MSKMSRIFRSRSNQAANLAVQPLADLDYPTFVEPDLSACLAALYNSSTGAFVDEVHEAMIPAAPFAGLSDAAPDTHALLSFASNSAGENADSDDVLAILLQTIDPAAPGQDFGTAAVVAALFSDESAIISSSSPDSRRAELFIVEKTVAAVRSPAPFLTEVMDLESIAASARESATAASDDSSAFANGEEPCASDVANKQVVAEMNAVAEEFVAEQRHHAPPASASSAHERPQDRRVKRRALISAPIRVRTVEAESSGSQEIATTFDVSRSGILFHTQLACYSRGMQVAVVFPFSKSPKAVHTEQEGRVVRITELGDGLRGVAITFIAVASEDFATAHAPQQTEAPAAAPEIVSTKKPMVLAVDSDPQLRETLKMFLENEGYDVIAVSGAADAREVLDLFTPSLLVAEIEGQGNPGYDLCGYVKATPRLRHVPVVLTTVSAYPSDYSRAHTLGAVVCMAKPYKQERLGHIVRLLAPLPEHVEKTAAPHTADPTRVPGRDFTAHNGSRDRKTSVTKSLFGKLFNKLPARR
ncbi:MAG TPA: response regulator [Candidatus Acidoferrales bacterium]